VAVQPSIHFKVVRSVLNRILIVLAFLLTLLVAFLVCMAFKEQGLFGAIVAMVQGGVASTCIVVGLYFSLKRD